MILNPFALMSLFVGTISLLLTTAAALSALHFHHQWKKSEGPDERARAENCIHLSLLLLFTAFLLRLATWPLFYILLQSLIPVVPGAMCIYGTTQVMPAFTAFLQVLKPAAFFLVGGFLLFYKLDLSLKNRPLVNESIRMLVVASAVSAADAVAEIIFILLFSPPGAAVSCCTVVADLVLPAKPLTPLPLFGSSGRDALIAGYHGFNLGLAGFLGLLIRKKNSKRAWVIFAAVAALINAIITYGAFKDYWGPRLMSLPDHHCLYCLLQYEPVSIAILGLFILGTFCAVWPLWLRHTAADAAKERLASLNRILYKWAVVFLLASWAILCIKIIQPI
jgi:hypothetical protein